MSKVQPGTSRNRVQSEVLGDVACVSLTGWLAAKALCFSIWVDFMLICPGTLRWFSACYIPAMESMSLQRICALAPAFQSKWNIGKQSNKSRWPNGNGKRLAQKVFAGVFAAFLTQKLALLHHCMVPMKNHLLALFIATPVARLSQPIFPTSLSFSVFPGDFLRSAGTSKQIKSTPGYPKYSQAALKPVRCVFWLLSSSLSWTIAFRTQIQYTI